MFTGTALASRQAQRKSKVGIRAGIEMSLSANAEEIG